MSISVPHAAPTEVSIHREGARRMGFFTDTSVCIGCKACEVACKQWNDLPADGSQFRRGGSYDHTGSLNATTWRHVRFIELLEPSPTIREEAERSLAAGAGGQMPDLIEMANAAGFVNPPAPSAVAGPIDLVQAAVDHDHWVFMSNVCKHCTHAGCMDACPTGALIRTEFETVVLQPDICNGCGYCVPSCPFGVVARSEHDGRASKCTLCYDRMQDGLEPACAKSCPTDSIQFGFYDELIDVAERRVAALHERGLTGAYLYGAGDAPEAELAGGLGAFFLLTEPPERYGLPAEAESPIQKNVIPATAAGMGAAVAAAAAIAVSVQLDHRRSSGTGDARERSLRLGPLALLAIGTAVFEVGRELTGRLGHRRQR